MSQTNNPCALLIFIMAVSVEVSANTVPVTDLAKTARRVVDVGNYKIKIMLLF